MQYNILFCLCPLENICVRPCHFTCQVKDNFIKHVLRTGNDSKMILEMEIADEFDAKGQEQTVARNTGPSNVQRIF